MMATNHFLGARQPFDDSSLNEQEIQALQSSFYTQSPCSFPQDNLQQLQQNHYYLSEPNSSFNGLDESCMSMPPAPPLEADMDSFGLGVSSFSHPSNHGYCYDYTHSQTPDIFYNSANGTAACPRSWQQSYDPRMMEGLSLSDVSSHYHPREQHHGLLIDTESSQNFYHRQASMSRTPPSLPDALSCKAEDDEDAVSNNEEGKAEEPYAKLIHRALMGAPNYSMALQEIYQWFVDNTEKGSSSGSGWRNSIRHNLSMNAVRPPSPSLPILLAHHTNNPPPPGLPQNRPRRHVVPLRHAAQEDVGVGAGAVGDRGRRDAHDTLPQDHLEEVVAAGRAPGGQRVAPERRQEGREHGGQDQGAAHDVPEPRVRGRRR